MKTHTLNHQIVALSGNFVTRLIIRENNPMSNLCKESES